MSSLQSNQQLSQIQTLLTQDVREANVWSQFSRRKRQLSAEGFVHLLVLGWLRHPRASLNDLIRSGPALGIRLTASGLHQRLNGRAVVLLAAVLNLAFQRLFGQCGLPMSRLKTFRALHITDSTQISLPSTVSSIFAGNSHNSSVKLQVIWDYLHGHVAGLEMTPGRQPDQTCRLHITHAADNTLQLFDLGYFKQEHLRDIAHAQAFFVCRFHPQTALFETATDMPFDLHDWLHHLSGREGECAVRLGQRVKLPIRLFARRVPAAQVQARRRAAKRKARKHGYTCQASTLDLLAWDVLVTNLPDEWFPAEGFALYRLRMQIEWLFRLWKQEFAVDAFRPMRLERVLCQLYARVIGAVLCQTLIAPWRWRRDEYSPVTCCRIIRDHIVALMRGLTHQGYGLKAWMTRVEADFRQFARATQRRKSPSTVQRLQTWGLT